MKTNFNNIVTRLNRKQGFSLVELMIVVAIIGILAALAIPRFQQFQAKSKQAEARSNLAHIYTLQLSYNGDNDTFSSFEFLTLGGGTGGLAIGASPDATTWSDVNTCNTTNDIGFRVTDCKKVRYAYINVGSQNQFTATAGELDGGATTSRRVFPGCSTGMSDAWQIDENKQLYNLAVSGENALQGCNN